MLEKFRELSFSGKIAVMFSAVILLIVSLISVGLLVKSFVDSGTDVPAPSQSSSTQPTPTPSETPDVTPVEEEPIIDDSTVPGISDGYNVAEQFFYAVCNISGKSYSEYVSGVKKYLSTDSPFTVMTEAKYNSYQSQSCQINAGNFDAGIDGEGRYGTSMAVTVTTKYKDVDQEMMQNSPANVSVYQENGKWKVYSISIG
jgi:hypothetical protein